MFAAHPGDIVFSKIDARNGAIGILPPTIEKAVVTSEFPVFVVNPEKLDAAFLQRLLRASGFLNDIRQRATGTSGRKRITPEAFLDLRIPLLPLAQQQQVIHAFDQQIAAAVTKEHTAKTIEAQAMANFEAALGLQPPPPLPDRPVLIAAFKNLDRWSHDGVLRATQVDVSPTAWPTVRLADVISDLENGWSPKCLERQASNEEWGVLKLGAASFGTYNEADNKALPPHLIPRPYLEVRPGDLLITRANISRLVGAATLVRETRRQLLLCDKIFRVVWRMTTPIIPEFLAAAFRTTHARRQIEMKLTGTSPTMKNISKPSLLSLTFPLPPIDTQRTLSGTFHAVNTQVYHLRQQAAALRGAALATFQTAAYGTERPQANATIRQAAAE